MIRQRQQKPEMLAAVLPTRPEEPLTLAGRNAMTQRNGPNLQPLAKSGRHRKTPALHLSGAACQDEAAQKKSQRPDPQVQPQTAEADRELENLPPPPTTRRPLKLAPLPPAAASELKDPQQPVKARGGGKTAAAAAVAVAVVVPPPAEPKAEACPRKGKATPAREVSPARSPERPPLCRMRPVVEFPKAAAPNIQQQQQPGVGTSKTLLLPVPQSERPRLKSPGGDENFISSTPPPSPSTRKCGPLSLSVSPSRLALDTKVGKAGCAPTSSECGGQVEGSPGRARPRLRRIPRLESDQGRSAPSQAAAPAESVAGLPPQEKKEEEEEAKPGHLVQAGGQRAERAEKALRGATRVLEKASRRTPAILDGPRKANRKMVVNVIPAAAVH